MVQASHTVDSLLKEIMPTLEKSLKTTLDAFDLEDALHAEEVIIDAMDEVTKCALREWIESKDEDAQHLNIDKQLYYRMKGMVAQNYRTMRGEVRVKRHVYRPSRVHNGATVCPLELKIGMIERTWTPKCAESMAYLAQELPERSAARMAEKMGVLRYSGNSFKRIARDLGGHWEERRDEYEERLIEEMPLAGDVAQIAVSIDRVSVPMDENGDINYRMAYCGAVALCDAQGEVLQTLRYGRLPGEGEHEIRQQMLWDVRALKKRLGEFQIVTLSDGAKDMCRILDHDYPDAPRYVDYYHLMEKLHVALLAYYTHLGKPHKAREIFDQWRHRLLNEYGAINAIETEIIRWDAEDVRFRNDRPVHWAITYLNRCKNNMNYAYARAHGHPIGSGHVEATCKQLVQMRMKRNGQRWKPGGGQAILTLRSFAVGARWNTAMQVMLPDFKGNIEVVYEAA